MVKNMTEVNLALIGCGAAARKYYLPVLKLRQEIAENIYFVDKNLSLAKEIAAEAGSKRITTDHNEIMDKVQGAIICVPHFLHHSLSLDFLRRKINVLCEKPLAESAREATEMVSTATENNVELCVNNTRRLFPAFKKVKEIISNGELGELRSITYFESNKFAWASATPFYVDPRISSKGVLLDLGAHILDLICWWIGEKPELVSCQDDSFDGPESHSLVRAKHMSCHIEVKLNRHLDFDSGLILKERMAKFSVT